MAEFNKIEKKWQDRWAKAKIFEVKEEPKKKKYYVLEMYPYPSSSGLHMGHARNYAIGDCFARYKRMHGFNVLYPMGYDSFGLPAENAAIKARSHPKLFTEKAIKNFVRQQKELGLSYDWNKMLASHTPEYYKWDQWIFLQLFKKGLAYKKVAAVNWCPECNTVLANEQVVQGKCWRHTETDVIQKELNQWFFKITDYADQLLDDIEKLKEWPEDVKQMQRNWIGRKEWIDVDYQIEGTDKKITVSTTRPDTNYGATFIVLAPEHPLLSKEAVIIPDENRKDVDNYIKYALRKTEEERINEKGRKSGVFTGLYCLNNLTKKRMPIWITDFVLMTVGTGAVVGVPGHDIRDFEFAEQFGLDIVRVVVGSDGDKSPITTKEQVQEEEGTMINSDFLDGMNIHDATKKIMDYLEKKGEGKRIMRYHLKDWLISRQRFWGCPIPIVYCEKCGEVPVPENDLPVKLPDDIKFTFTKGNPLENVKDFINTKCPKCGGKATRETDTMDTFVDSSWYMLRYCDAKNDKKIFDSKKVNYWLPIDTYIGGREHATGHLLYFRFFTKFFKDIGIINFDEPAIRLFNQGMLHKDGYVMSKSRGNVITQEEIAKKYGIDTARFFMLFVASPGKDMEWSDETVEGTFRFLNKAYKLAEKKLSDKVDKKVQSKMHKTIKGVTGDIDNFRLNLALIKIMEYTDFLSKQEQLPKDALKALILLLSPFTPHIAEEMWEKIGEKPFASLTSWPKHDDKKIDDKIEETMNIIDKAVTDIRAVLKLANLDKPKKVSLFISEQWKYEFFKKLRKELAKTRDVGSIIKAVMDKEHGKDISRLVPKLVKDESKIPSVVLDQKTEFDALKDAVKHLEQEFRCTVEVVKAHDSKEAKAQQAMPSKPAILIE